MIAVVLEMGEIDLHRAACGYVWRLGPGYACREEYPSVPFIELVSYH